MYHTELHYVYMIEGSGIMNKNISENNGLSKKEYGEKDKKIIRKRVIIYTILTFLLVWGVMIPYSICGGKYNSKAMELMLIYSMLCPALSVIITRKITNEGYDMTGPKSMKLGIDLRNKKWIFYILAFILPIVYFDLGELIYYAIFPKTLDFSQLNNLGIPKKLLFLLPLSVIASTFIFSFGALGEEIGWRGYLYPKLEELFGTTKAVIIGGIIWGVWHYPALYAGHNFGHNYIGEPWTGFIVFTIFTIVVGAILYYFTKRTDSVWGAAFMHAANNAFSSATILGLAYSDKKISGLALESPIRLLIISIPVIILGIFSLIRLEKK